MKVRISSDAERDIQVAFEFYERQVPGLGRYFRDCTVADIEALAIFGGIHETAFGYFRMLAKRFPFTIYYQCEGEVATVIAVIDARREPAWIERRFK